jgi:hypothetical protein
MIRAFPLGSFNFASHCANSSVRMRVFMNQLYPDGYNLVQGYVVRLADTRYHRGPAGRRTLISGHMRMVLEPAARIGLASPPADGRSGRNVFSYLAPAQANAKTVRTVTEEIEIERPLEGMCQRHGRSTSVWCLVPRLRPYRIGSARRPRASSVRSRHAARAGEASGCRALTAVAP